MRGSRLLTVVAALTVAATACQPPAATVSPTVTVPSPSPEVAAATVLPTEPPATPRFPAPAELLGRWGTTLAPGDNPILTIRETGYVIQRFDTGAGRIEVHGDEIDFLASNLCNGVGRYRWTIDGDELHLEPIEPDECPGRAEALKDKTYTRLG